LAGWVPLTASIHAAGPVGLYEFNSLLPGSPTASGSQNAQGLTLDSSASGNLLAQPYPNGNYLMYGANVVGNGFNPSTSTGSNTASAAIFPSTATLSNANIIGGGKGLSPTLQPTATMSVGCQLTPNVIVAGAKQVMVCYGSDAAGLAAYALYHSGSSATNHLPAFSINIGGSLVTATGTTTLVVGSSYFVLGTYDGINLRIYVNGVLQGTTATTGPISYASIGGFGLTFGNDPSLTDANIQGAIGICAIYNYALTQTQITYLARQGQLAVQFPWRH
jgi:hypothetical protein